MKTSLIFVCSFLLSVWTVNGVPQQQVQLQSVRFKPQSAMIVAFSSCQNESHANIFYFDIVTRKWSPHKYSTCLSTPKDVLSFCQRIYPKLNIMNIYQMESVLKFSATTPAAVEETRYGRPYKCLHGQFKEAKLPIPSRCQIQHLFSQTDCKSDEHWRLLSNEKCKSLGYYLNSSNLLQWCDAFSGGISSFSGIEFVCCPTLTSTKNKSEQKKSNKEAKFMEEDGTETSTDEEEDIDDENDYYQAEKSDQPNDIGDKADSDQNDNENQVQQTTDTINSSKSKKSGRSTMSYATVFFIIGFSCTIVFAFIYVRIIKPGRCCKPSKDEVILINSFNTDDTHVNSMQQNGYENPTYRFFEQKA